MIKENFLKREINRQVKEILQKNDKLKSEISANLYEIYKLKKEHNFIDRKQAMIDGRHKIIKRKKPAKKDKKYIFSNMSEKEKLEIYNILKDLEENIIQ